MRADLYPAVALFLLLPSVSLAQEEITSIPFDSVPPGVQVTSGPTAPIDLQGDVDIAGQLETVGEISTSGGIRFPDGTLQVTATNSALGQSANAGLYSNTIADLSPPNPYTEICIKAGEISFDIHGGANEPTTGGNCLPGDIGWILERSERDSGTAASWTDARMECLKDGMRLPEPFEWRFACDDSNTYAVNELTDDWEWVSNSVKIVYKGTDVGPDTTFAGVQISGNGSCSHMAFGSLGRNTGVSENYRYRCAL